MAICGGIGIIFRKLTQAFANRVVVDVIEMCQVIVSITHTAVGETPLPDGEHRTHAMGEASFNKLDGPFNGDDLGCDQQVNVVRHHNERMKLVMAFAPIVLQSFKEEFSISRN